MAASRGASKARWLPKREAKFAPIKLVTFMVLGAQLSGCSGPQLQPWHTAKLKEEFTADTDEVNSFAAYQALEERLYAELDEQVYQAVETGSANALVRYSSGSLADPRNDAPDWNRSFLLMPEAPIGGVLLLHGMSDSPYSLRAIGETLFANGYTVLGLRMPGHGTAPSGLKYVRPEDMIAATRLGMAELAAALPGKPLHIIGYSTGASLALGFALDAGAEIVAPEPASLVLISPAIRVSRTAGVAGFKNGISGFPGLGSLAWLNVMQEFDPYKYNSFATNAGSVVHQLTTTADQRIAELAKQGTQPLLPPTLVLKSTVDATVTTEAVVDNLLALLQPNRHELVLFDVNRAAALEQFMTSDPGPLTRRLEAASTLPFYLSVVSNATPETLEVAVTRKLPYSSAADSTQNLDAEWPADVLSLSHVALPFPPDDPLYGSKRPTGQDNVFLGELATRGERGLLQLPSDWVLRMRYNPFFDYLEQRIVDWLASHSAQN